MATTPVYDSFWRGRTPANPSGISTPTQVCNIYVPQAKMKLVGCAVFRDLGDGGQHLAVVRLTTGGAPVAGTPIKAARWGRHFAAGTPGTGAWFNIWFHPQVELNAFDEFKLIVYFSTGLWWSDRGYFAGASTTIGQLEGPADGGAPATNGSIGTTLTWNVTSFANSDLHGIDPIYRLV